MGRARRAGVIELDPDRTRAVVAGRRSLDLGQVLLLTPWLAHQPVREIAVVRERQQPSSRGRATDGNTLGPSEVGTPDVGRPCGSRIVVTTPGGLCKAK
jgi:hypothetical protein